MSDLAIHLIAAAGLLIIGAVNGWFLKVTGSGTLRRNPYVGIRTRATMRDDEVWSIAHQAALPWTRRAAVTAVLLAIVTVVARTGWVTMTSMFVPLVLMVLGGIVGDRAARRVPN